jgi:hypothetical protein
METPTVRPKRDRRVQPRIPPPDMARTTPEDGDIVVREKQRGGTLVYVLHIAPRADQCVLHGRGEAIAQARASARRQHTRAWLTDEGYDFTLLDDFRAVTTHEDVSNRLRAEFLDMPGLRLTPEQVQRLCGVERTLCQIVLDSLVDERFLCAKPDGHYARFVDGAMSLPPVAKADRRADRRIATAS